MQEHARMMAAWEQARAACVLVTVVGTRGSSYRSPGARMLILPDGSRIGAVSGGCLEGELGRRAHWWTAESSAVLKTFDTSTQEDHEGFGLGCGGGIDLLLERLDRDPIVERLDRDATEPTHPLLAQERVTRSREASALAVVLGTTQGAGLRVGERFALGGTQHPEIAALLRRSVEIGYSFTAELRDGVDAGCRVFLESLAPPVQLVVCGAGMDAQPVVALAATLGWSVVVVDQRTDMARATRFPAAEQVIAARDVGMLSGLRLDARTAAIVMSHSFAQDTFFLGFLLEALRKQPIRYLGVLGSRRRTLDLLARLGRETVPPHLHAPAGLDIGAETPEQIAFSILSEVQACFADRTGGALRDRAGSIHGREHQGNRDERGSGTDEPTSSRVMRDCGLL